MRFEPCSNYDKYDYKITFLTNSIILHPESLANSHKVTGRGMEARIIQSTRPFEQETIVFVIKTGDGWVQSGS